MVDIFRFFFETLLKDKTNWEIAFFYVNLHLKKTNPNHLYSAKTS